MLIPIMKHPHSGVVLAWTELQSQGDAFGWVSEGCLRHVGARFLNEKSLGYQWSRLQLEPGIVRDVTTTENIKINQKKFRLTLRGPGRGEASGCRCGQDAMFIWNHTVRSMAVVLPSGAVSHSALS